MDHVHIGIILMNHENMEEKEIAEAPPGNPRVFVLSGSDYSSV